MLLCREPGRRWNVEKQALAGLSLSTDSDFGTLSWLEAQCGGPQHRGGGSLMVLPLAT